MTADRCNCGSETARRVSDWISEEHPVVSREYSAEVFSGMTQSSPDPLRLLVVDDDAIFSGMLKKYLESEGCTVGVAFNGNQAIESLGREAFDLMILDIMMPELTGIEVLKRLRPDNQIPVIMLTAKGDDLDRILGLELGADDYLTKPCNPRELLARVHAVIRRSGHAGAAHRRSIRIDDVLIRPDDREVLVAETPGSREDRRVPLTQTEFDMLYLLMSHPGKLITKAEISREVLGKPLSRWDRSIDVHISNLRRKLGRHSRGMERIRTVRGSGYIYDLNSGTR